MSGTGKRERYGSGGQWRRWPGGSVRGARRGWIGAGLLVLVGGVGWLGVCLPRHLPGHRPARAPATLLSASQTPFEASFAQAQAWYLRAEVRATQQLEALEEWDPDGMRGSAPEIYRRRVIARTAEIVRAEAAARDALCQARTQEERYHAVRLLVHLERDMGRVLAEREAARKLLSLRPQATEAALLLEQAEAEVEPTGRGR